MSEKGKRDIKKDSSKVLNLIVSPLEQFTKLETFEGILLLISTIMALLWANSQWSGSYESLWGIELSVGVGTASISKSLLHWINDGLMVVFFFVVGMEIKREIFVGELSAIKKASLPVIAAFGGMVIPALIYFTINLGTSGIRGWGIPMATDIAFSLGVLALLGKRIPAQLRVFLMAFAIADDIGAVIVIAVFYASAIAWYYLLIASVILAILIVSNWAGVRSLATYAFLGVLLWLAFLHSGIHATVAGVLLAFTVPASSRLDKPDFLKNSRAILAQLEGKTEIGGNYEDTRETTVRALAQLAEDFETPARRFERGLHPWVSYLIVPLFALSNAGAKFEEGFTSLLHSSVAVGAFLGLLVGKQIGITLFSWIAVKTRLAAIPTNVTWRQIYGVSWLGGIGFTMSLFITGLAFDPGLLADLSKSGIYAASVIAAIGGLWILKRSSTFSVKLK